MSELIKTIAATNSNFTMEVSILLGIIVFLLITIIILTIVKKMKDKK